MQELFMTCMQYLFMHSLITLCAHHQARASGQSSYWSLVNCNQLCSQVIREKVIFDTSCNHTCQVGNCHIGCLRKTLQIQMDCSEEWSNESDGFFYELGCSRAIVTYKNILKNIFGIPPAPTLVPQLRTNTSVTIRWQHLMDLSSEIQFLVQLKYFDIPSSWEYYFPHHPLSVNQATLQDLKPYTKYKFRIVWLILGKYFLVHSQDSVAISTLPGGHPASSPRHLEAISQDHSRIYLKWDPPLFPSGYLISYILKLHDSITGTTSWKEIKAHPVSNHYIFTNLHPNTSYVIRVASKNVYGEGPFSELIVRTAQLKPSENFRPVLLIASRNKIFQQNITTMYKTEFEILKIKSNFRAIADISVQEKKMLLFILTTDGLIIRVNSSDASQRIIINFTNAENLPKHISVDWLFDKLYVEIEKNSRTAWILQCDLSGNNITTVLDSIRGPVIDMIADPIHGYLFWSTPDTLMRQDLAFGNVKPKAILKRSYLGPFAIDMSVFRLFIVDEFNNTVLSVSIDGLEVTNIRSKTQQPQFRSVISFAYNKGLFYWTNGKDLMIEDYSSEEDTYYHNSFTHRSQDGPYVSICLIQPSSQPIPVPSFFPTNVQVIFGDTRALITWEKPRHIEGFAIGAWSNWRYEINAIHDRNSVIRESNITALSYEIKNLKPSTSYRIRIRGYSDGGFGPWSQDFDGETFGSSVNDYSILWSDSHILIKEMTDLSHYIFLVTQNGYCYRHDLKKNVTLKIESLKDIESVSSEYLADKIYWSNPIQQIIFRTDEKGESIEIVQMQTSARHLRIDSVGGFIYWSTHHSVEYSRLNGQDGGVYFRRSVFSGIEVLGLTIDFISGHVYWFTRSSLEFTLHKTLLKSKHVQDGNIATIPMASKQFLPNGVFHFFENKLFWLTQSQLPIISDINIRHFAVLYQFNKSVPTAFFIRRNHPPNKEKSVIPAQLFPNTIRISGTHDNFTIAWQAVDSADLVEVYYKVVCRTNSTWEEAVVSESYFKVKLIPPPYSLLTVVIQPFTYWSFGVETNRVLRSPMYFPSKPSHLRLYVVDFWSTSNYSAASLTTKGQLRWEAPTSPNGIITGYRIFCNLKRLSTNCMNTSAPAYVTSLDLHDFSLSSEFIFQVAAVNAFGQGQLSDPYNVASGPKYPLPLILAAFKNQILEFDADLRQETVTILHSSTILLLSVYQLENVIFYADRENKLYQSFISTNERTKLVASSEKIIAMALDWVSRSIFWIQVKEFGTEVDFCSAIYSLDLADGQQPKIVMNISNAVQWMQILPLHSLMLWTQRNFGSFEYEIVALNLTTHRIWTFLVSSKFVAVEDPKNFAFIFFIDLAKRQIVKADHKGCKCYVIFSLNLISNEYIPDTISGDHFRLFLSGGSKSSSIYVDIQDGKESVPIIFESRSFTQIIPLGRHEQPLPENECLLPQVSEIIPNIVNVSSTWILLYIPEVLQSRCASIRLPRTYYLINYGPKEHFSKLACLSSNLTVCITIKTYENLLHLKSLKPFTNYLVHVEPRNYYSDLFSTPKIYAHKWKQFLEIQTAHETPSPVRNVTCRSVSPSRIHVTWMEPEFLSGNQIEYEISWKCLIMKGSQKYFHHQQANSSKGTFSLEFGDLPSGENCRIKVFAYFLHQKTFSTSEETQIKMLSQPKPAYLLKSSSHSLTIGWISHQKVIKKHRLEYRMESQKVWNTTQSFSATRTDSILSFEISNLLPACVYFFRLILIYNTTEHFFVWPNNSGWGFKTLGDRPDPPGIPVIQILDNEVYRVIWNIPRSNGAPIYVYHLEMSTLYHTKWTEIYNGSEPFWIAESLTGDDGYVFRVRAENSFGLSDYSLSSLAFSSTYMSEQPVNDITLIIVLPSLIFITFMIVLILGITQAYKIYNNGKQTKLQQRLPAMPMPTVELANLRNVSHSPAILQQANALYGISEHTLEEEFFLLPQIPLNRIAIMKLLGSGAFGEVYEGIVSDIPNVGQNIKVAIKTLKQDATEMSKIEFIREAKLMSYFKHEHILHMLGVCLDNDPIYIILELMEGDLLTYLRSNRPSGDAHSSLFMKDLLSMCIDVTKGCCYLEQMHFVHRDLACRNCLISSQDPSKRKVKIADFGLARDIYKNDYYRKKNQGCLPIRWMAPESLIDGVFTTQSDVWSFGVLLWEVLTLGNQPYPTLSNDDVYKFVINKGTPNLPTYSPLEIYSLLLKCWNFKPEDRPSFKFCYDYLQNYAEQTKNFGDVKLYENIHNTISQVWSESSTEIFDLSNDITTTTSHHSYLELIGENFFTTIYDGYEVPKVSSKKESTVYSHKPIYMNDQVFTKSAPNLLDNCNVTNQNYIFVSNCSELTTDKSLEVIKEDEFFKLNQLILSNY